jgi:hypothetical protein
MASSSQQLIRLTFGFIDPMKSDKAGWLDGDLKAPK